MAWVDKVEKDANKLRDESQVLSRITDSLRREAMKKDSLLKNGGAGIGNLIVDSLRRSITIHANSIEIHRLDSLIIALEREVESSKGDSVIKTGQKMDLDRSLAKCRDDARKQRDQLGAGESDSTPSAGSLIEMQSKLDEQLSQCSGIDAALSAIEQELRVLEATNRSMTAYIHEKRKAKADLIKGNIDESVSLGTLIGRIDSMRADTAKNSGEAMLLRKQAAELANKVVEMDKEEKTLRDSISSYKTGCNWFPSSTYEEAKRFYGQTGFASLRNLVVNGWMDRGAVYAELLSDFMGGVRFALGTTLATTDSSGSTDTAKPSSALQRFLTSGGGMVLNFTYPMLMIDAPKLNFRMIWYSVFPKISVDLATFGASNNLTTWNIDGSMELHATYFMEEIFTAHIQVKSGYVTGSDEFFANLGCPHINNSHAFLPGFFFGQTSLGLSFKVDKSMYSIFANLPFRDWFPEAIGRRIQPTIGVQITALP